MLHSLIVSVSLLLSSSPTDSDNLARNRDEAAIRERAAILESGPARASREFHFTLEKFRDHAGEFRGLLSELQKEATSGQLAEMRSRLAREHSWARVIGEPAGLGALGAVIMLISMSGGPGGSCVTPNDRCFSTVLTLGVLGIAMFAIAVADEHLQRRKSIRWRIAELDANLKALSEPPRTEFFERISENFSGQVASFFAPSGTAFSDEREFLDSITDGVLKLDFREASLPKLQRKMEAIFSFNHLDKDARTIVLKRLSRFLSGLRSPPRKAIPVQESEHFLGTEKADQKTAKYRSVHGYDLEAKLDYPWVPTFINLVYWAGVSAVLAAKLDELQKNLLADKPSTPRAPFNFAQSLLDLFNACGAKT